VNRKIVVHRNAPDRMIGGKILMKTAKKISQDNLGNRRENKEQKRETDYLGKTTGESPYRIKKP